MAKPVLLSQRVSCVFPHGDSVTLTSLLHGSTCPWGPFLSLEGHTLMFWEGCTRSDLRVSTAFLILGCISIPRCSEQISL